MRKKVVRYSLVLALLSPFISGCSSSTGPATNSGGTTGTLAMPSVIDFGAISVGQVKDTVIPLFNTSTDTITITADAVSSADGRDTNFTNEVVLAPSAYRYVHLQFAPSTATKESAYDTIRYQLRGKSYYSVMTLTATGIGSGGGGPVNSLFIPDTINFGPATIGQWKDTSILIVNIGNGPLLITSSVVTSLEAQDTNFIRALSLTQRGSYATIHLQFKPSVAGPRSASDIITYAANGTSQSVMITLLAQGVTSGGGGGGGGTGTPGPGSTYTYNVDTNGVVVSPTTLTIVSNSLSYGGKNDVVEVRDDTGGIEYYHVEQNGDLSLYMDFNQLSGAGGLVPLPATWVTIPLGSKKTTSQVLFDSAVTIQGSPLPVTILISDTGRYIGTASVNAAGKSFATDQGSLTIAGTASIGGLITVFSFSMTSNIWYAKQIAFYPRRRDVVASYDAQTSTSTTSTTNYLLRTYQVK